MKTFKEMMTTCSGANAAGFSHESPKEGPTAGLTMPFMTGMVRRKSLVSNWIKSAINSKKKKVG